MALLFSRKRGPGLPGFEMISMDERYRMATASEALGFTCQSVDQREHDRVWDFVKTVVEPAIEKAARNGKTETSVEANYEDLAEKVNAILLENGYETYLTGDVIIINWANAPMPEAGEPPEEG